MSKIHVFSDFFNDVLTIKNNKIYEFCSFFLHLIFMPKYPVKVY